MADVHFEEDIEGGDYIRLEARSNCIFDDHAAQYPDQEFVHGETHRSHDHVAGNEAESSWPRRLSTPRLASSRISTSAFASATSLASSPPRQSFLSRYRKSSKHLGLSATPGLAKPGRLEPVRSCLSWIWLPPVVVLAASAVLALLGSLCISARLVIFDSCGTTLLPIGLLLPCLALLVFVCAAQPTKTSQQYDNFYSDALLEEVLAGENILDVYTVTTRGSPPREGNVVVFLSGIGGVPETWRMQVEAVVDAGFAAIQIQLPGSGCLSAIEFSLERAAQTVIRVLEQEVLDDPIMCDSSVGYLANTPTGLFASAELVGPHLGAGSPALQAPASPDEEQNPRRIVLVAWGLSAHVAMYLASSKRLGDTHLAGIVLAGSPQLPSWPLSWTTRLAHRAFRVSWIAQLARLSEYAGMGPQNRRAIPLQSLHPEARSDWGVCFEHHREALRVACSEFLGPVLCLSSQPWYLAEIRELFGGRLRQSGSNVDAILAPGHRMANYQSFPPPEDEELAAHIINFASAHFI
mmetsp:Transcript_7027/g.14092  ORF Transcript_7027/g.14092 Transcript_7027/m.14092 type:complete len:522 (-) Transcript_7027:230-1795(-)